MDYLRDPDEIYRESFAIIKEEVDFSQFPLEIRAILIRLVHATATPEILADIVWYGDVLDATLSALSKDATILVDTNMVNSGIIKTQLPEGSLVKCFIHGDKVSNLANSYFSWSCVEKEFFYYKKWTSMSKYIFYI